MVFLFGLVWFGGGVVWLWSLVPGPGTEPVS